MSAGGPLGGEARHLLPPPQPTPPGRDKFKLDRSLYVSTSSSTCEPTSGSTPQMCGQDFALQASHRQELVMHLQDCVQRLLLRHQAQLEELLARSEQRITTGVLESLGSRGAPQVCAVAVAPCACSLVVNGDEAKPKHVDVTPDKPTSGKSTHTFAQRESPKHVAGKIDKSNHVSPLTHGSAQDASPELHGKGFQDLESPKEFQHKSLGDLKRESAEAKRLVRNYRYLGDTGMAAVIKSPRFSNSLSVCILFNAVMIGVQTEWQAQNHGLQEPVLFGILEYICNFIFTLELILKVSVLRREFFSGEDARWNTFDLLIVLSALVDMALQLVVNAQGASGLTTLRALRVLKLVRTVRAIRVMSCFRELRLIMLGIMSSVQSLVWLILLLTFIMFIVAVFITQVVTQFTVEQMEVDAHLPAALADSIDANFSSMPRTLYALYKAVSDGESWGNLCDPLFEISPLAGALFMAYITFSVFVLLNVITGVFVESAHKCAMEDHDHTMLEETEQLERLIESVAGVFNEADADNSGELTPEEFVAHFSNPRVQAFFRVLKLDVDVLGPERLFHLLDFDGGGRICIDEFVTGCTKLRGEAKSYDLEMLNQKMHRDRIRFDRIDRRTEKILSILTPASKMT